MSIFVIGINHKTAPVTLREKVYFPADKLPCYLQDILHRGIARDVLLLSTCNRSELYCEADQLSLVCEWFYAQATLSTDELKSMTYVYKEENAIAHMMQVACGL